MRLLRKKAEAVFEPLFGKAYKFSLGKADILRPGTDLAILATGLTVAYALQAAEELHKKHISAKVINIHTLPLDESAVLKAARETGLIVTVENHNVVGGLGSAVAEVLSEHYPTPMLRLGARNSYGEVGTREYLAEHFGFHPAGIVQSCLAALKRK